MERTTSVPSIPPHGAPFKIFFYFPPSDFRRSQHYETVIATYQLDRLLKKDNHSDIFSLRHVSIDAPDPNPTGCVLEARRFIIDGSDGLPPRTLQYRLRSAKRLAKLTELEESQRTEVKKVELQVRAAERNRDRSYKEWSKTWSDYMFDQEADAYSDLLELAMVSWKKLKNIEKDYAAVLWQYLCLLVSRKGTKSIASAVTALVLLIKAAEEHDQRLEAFDEETEFDGLEALFTLPD
ncbi:hypothetical protein CMUS01_14047 [Colletotrichum musicola]|uniref:Uncharacterized protein n=1 Tax=Colletotrichum musicola TaxID=2175873 RepID=A0A8H6J727_9PEZI|nr:hypothetical protein CMUS01_14047 [Colletotrichum musicola]